MDAVGQIKVARAALAHKAQVCPWHTCLRDPSLVHSSFCTDVQWSAVETPWGTGLERHWEHSRLPGVPGLSHPVSIARHIASRKPSMPLQFATLSSQQSMRLREAHSFHAYLELVLKNPPTSFLYYLFASIPASSRACLPHRTSLLFSRASTHFVAIPLRPPEVALCEARHILSGHRRLCWLLRCSLLISLLHCGSNLPWD